MVGRAYLELEKHILKGKLGGVPIPQAIQIIPGIVVSVLAMKNAADLAKNFDRKRVTWG
ncbi:MAG: hypothetical protein PHU63_00195 [Candidatus ainarchaeum sp.]|nr:hypothetical protein [Candidatus ainarchaeum sp.]